MTETGGSSPPGQAPVTRPPVQTENKTRIQRPMVCKVLLLNGEEYEVAIDKRAVGQLLYERVCDYLDLLERDYFGLQYKDENDSENGKYWMDLNKKITKQKKKGKMYFEFAVHFYPPDPTQLAESITRYLLCLQVRRDILSGKLPCSQATLAMLGSYAVQADIGDYDPVDHGTGIAYIQDMAFAPDQTEDLLYKIAALHKQHKGQTPEQAELHYLEYAKKIALYGIDLHKAKDSDYVDIMIGVGATGISVYRDNLRINRFVWPKILKISYRRNKFLLRIRPAEFETFESWIAFRLPNNKLAKRLWKIAVEHHAFLRLRSSDDARKRVGLPRFGSKYRYSGRTLYQTRLNASMADRPSKHFERTHSRQSLNSVLNNNKTRSLDNVNHHREHFFERTLDINNTSFDTRHDRIILPATNYEDRTPLQSPLPREESPKFLTQVIRHNIREESYEDEDFEPELPEVPQESPQEIRRPTLNHHQVKGTVPTALATITLTTRRLESHSDSESEQSRPSSLHSVDQEDDLKVKVKPVVAPKPGKVQPPPVAKKPEKPPKPETPSKPEKPPKADKPPKAEKPSKVKKSEPVKNKEPVREMFM